jgi:hypothetical protein
MDQDLPVVLPVAMCAFRALLRLRNKKGTKAHTGASRTDLMADVTVHQLMASLVTAVLGYWHREALVTNANNLQFAVAP